MQTATTIAQDRAIATLINTFTVEPDKQQAVVDSLTQVTEKVMRFLPGFIAASVHKSLDGTRVANYAQWDSAAHFQAMFRNPDVAAHMKQVSSLAVSVLPARRLGLAGLVRGGLCGRGGELALPHQP